jgi:hypothetical protein
MKKVIIITLAIIFIFSLVGLIIYYSTTDSSMNNGCEGKKTQEEKDWCFNSLAKSNNNWEFCEKISSTTNYETENYFLRDFCYESVAYSTKNIEICKKISSDTSDSFDCEDTVNLKIAQDTKDSSKCNLIKDTYWKERCVIEIGKETLDLSLCAEENSYNFNCVVNIGQDTKDIQVCEIFSGNADYHVASCYESLAWRLCDPSICNKIEQVMINENISERKNSCISHAKKICGIN